MKPSSPLLMSLVLAALPFTGCEFGGDYESDEAAIPGSKPGQPILMENTQACVTVSGCQEFNSPTGSTHLVVLATGPTYWLDDSKPAGDWTNAYDIWTPFAGDTCAKIDLTLIGDK